MSENDPASPPPIPRTASTRDALANAGTKSKVHRSASMSAMPKSAASSAAAAGGNHIRVAVRCRPLNSDEKAKSTLQAVTSDIENNSILVNYQSVGKKVNKNVQFDKVFGVYSRQSEVYDSMVRPVVDEMLSGYNCTIFAYGPTGTGKTHTMEGDIRNEDMWGMIPRAARSIFENLSDSRFDFNLKVSYLEIYNEELRDLLNTAAEKPKLRLQEDLNHAVVCKGLEEYSVNSVDICMDLLRRGSRERQTAATFSNHNSSRSHSIFTFKLLVRETVAVGEEVIKTGQLNLVDLAGSECIGISGSRGDMAVEAGNINKSLLTLGRVISALVDGQPHTPYRDSKLTRLLQDSLGGRAKTSIIATVSPSVVSLEESLSTLDYAARARCVKNQPTINSTSQAKHVMKDLHYELESMRSQLQMSRDKNGVYMDPREHEELMNKLAAQTLALQEAETTIAVRDQEMKVLQDKQQEHLDQIASLTKRNENLQNQVEQLTDANHRLTQQLEIMYVHTETQRQIVVEQAHTESRLRAQAETLQHDLHDRNLDLEKVISRVVLLEGQESRRQTEGKALVAHVTSDQQRLNEALASLQSVAKKHRDDMQNMLQRLTAQSETWQNESHIRLHTLLKEQLEELVLTEDFAGRLQLHAKETMPASLHHHAEKMTSEIRSMQEQWMQWFQTGVLQLRGLSDELTQQSKHIDQTQSLVQAQAQELQERIVTWKNAQEVRVQEVDHLVSGFAQSMETHVTASTHSMAETVATAQGEFASKLAQFQQQMLSMFTQVHEEYQGLCSKVLDTSTVQGAETTRLANCHVTDCRDLVMTRHHREVAQSLDDLEVWRQVTTEKILDADHVRGIADLRVHMQETSVPLSLKHLNLQETNVAPAQNQRLLQSVTHWTEQTDAELKVLSEDLSTTAGHLVDLQSSVSGAWSERQLAMAVVVTDHQTNVSVETETVQTNVDSHLERERAVLGNIQEKVQQFDHLLDSNHAPHRGDTPVNVPAEESITFAVTKPVEEIVQAVVGDFIDRDQSADVVWREHVHKEDVAPRELTALASVAIHMTKSALDSHKSLNVQ